MWHKLCSSLHKASERIFRNRAIVSKAEILGATVLPKKNHRASIQEKIIAMAREAEYTFGQILVRSGQNLTALHVVPGCGLMCRTDTLVFSGKTVTDDMELTQIIQSQKRVIRLNKSILGKFIIENLQLKINNHLIPLVQFLEEFDKPVYFSENNASYVDSAFMYTQETKGLRPLFTQLTRWLAGFHQILFLQGKNFRKGDKKLLLTIYGAKFEGLTSSIIFLLLIGCSSIRGEGLSRELYPCPDCNRRRDECGRRARLASMPKTGYE